MDEDDAVHTVTGADVNSIIETVTAPCTEVLSIKLDEQLEEAM